MKILLTGLIGMHPTQRLPLLAIQRPRYDCQRQRCTHDA